MILLLACSPHTVHLDDLSLQFDPKSGTIDVFSNDQLLLSFSGVETGAGSASIDFQSGSYYFDELEQSLSPSTQLKLEESDDDRVAVQLLDKENAPLASLEITPISSGVLKWQFQLSQPQGDGSDRLKLNFACPQGPAVGGGAHAFDVDHQGEAFGLWVSEPGVGKSDQDSYPEDWFLQGTRHSSSFPQPFFLFPEIPAGLELQTSARIEADLCSTGSLNLTAWDSMASLLLFTGNSPLQIIERHALSQGEPMIPPDWAFAAWNDAIRGVDRVRAVAAALRESGASSSAIWTEDWKGGHQTTYGYHLTAEWEVDTELYPDASGLAAELEQQGFQWMAYFSPFVAEESEAAAEAAELVIQTSSGEPYWFPGITFQPTSVLDLSREDAREWAKSKMQAVLELGFDGWMTDFAEWLPVDARLKEADAMLDHNAYPLWWQSLSQEAVAGTDATYFSRSGWIGTPTLSPITWAGDQRTDFQADDGFPTVIPMGLGLGVGGVPFYTHDIAGYNSLGNEPSSKELFFRWCTLGAFTPIMRTHHGAFDEDNWQFDSDAETLAHYARYTQEHAKLFPYLKALAERARTQGTPLILPVAAWFEGADWGDMDSWMLGPSLLVAPVLKEGALSREVSLPEGVDWYDWWTGEPATSGTVDVPLESIAVFVPSGSIVPVFSEAPDSFLEQADPALLTLSEVDSARTIRVFGPGGSFIEADGTRYTVSGQASASGSAEGSFNSGSLEVNGLSIQIESPSSRSWRVEVYP
jgi:alpha-glucosidase (family GH31 glycosyl hydrolase)